MEEDENAGAWYESGGVRFLVYPSGFAGTNQATAASFRTDDFDAAIAHLRAAGVALIDYDFEGFQTVDGCSRLPMGTAPPGSWTARATRWPSPICNQLSHTKSGPQAPFTVPG